jgi:hypothetical protein
MNATQVAALFVRGMWMRRGADTLAAWLYGPCHVSTTVADVKRWTAGDTVRVTFVPSVREIPAVKGEVALQDGALAGPCPA